jgi:large subunit ribosomal protein L35
MRKISKKRSALKEQNEYINELNFLIEMPKIKTNSGAKKRFALTGSGKIKRKHAFKSHILTKKTKKQKRRLTHTGLIAATDQKAVKQLLALK